MKRFKMWLLPLLSLILFAVGVALLAVLNINLNQF